MVVESLLRIEVDWTVKNNDGMTALQSASHIGREEIVQLLHEEQVPEPDLG